MRNAMMRLSNIPASWVRWGALALGVLLILATAPLWWSAMNALADGIAGQSTATTEAADPEEAEHARDHGHEHGHEAPSITLSPQARKNINLQLQEVMPGSHERFIAMPALVVERPGESRYEIVAPFTGIVTGVNIVPGQLVKSGDLLFAMRLTHEDLVNAQKEFLATLGQLDVERRELERLKQINTSVMSRKVLLEKEYRIETLEAELKAQQNALHLHGLSSEQIERIQSERTLVRELKVFAPFLHQDASVHGDAESEHAFNKSASPGEHELVKQEFLVQDLEVQPGEAVETGQPLCHLTNYQTLFVEGRAFEQDAPEITEAYRENRGVQIIPEGETAATSILKNLPIVRVGNQIDPDSRALPFYVELPNQISSQNERRERRFATWRFKPGQRMQVRVPVDVWENVFLLPVEAVAQDGLESYVFVENGDKLERRPVHVLHRDQVHAVIANDGALLPHESVAQNAAHQLLMALKNQSGGGADPHAGHMH